MNENMLHLHERTEKTCRAHLLSSESFEHIGRDVLRMILEQPLLNVLELELFDAYSSLSQRILIQKSVSQIRHS